MGFVVSSLVLVVLDLICFCDKEIEVHSDSTVESVQRLQSSSKDRQGNTRGRGFVRVDKTVKIQPERRKIKEQVFISINFLSY